MTSPRKRRGGLIDRQVQVRDARLFVIATEGEVTEPEYFAALQEQDIIDNSRVKVRLIPTPPGEGTSAPNHVIARLQEFVREYQLLDADEFWLVLDVDRWHPRTLSEVCREAIQARYDLAISNPCFEVWLLLHFGDLPPDLNTARSCKRALNAILHTRDGEPYTRDAVHEAVVRAGALDDGRGRWPNTIGTRVHRLAERLLAT